MPERQTPERCSCGANLIAGARFCHMCGRPVFGPEVPEFAAATDPVYAPRPIPESTIAALSGQLPVNFSNPVGLRVAFLMALAIMLLEMIPGVNLLFPVWWLAAGWCAVLLYRRLTGFTLNVRSGARLGLITGVLTFLSMVIILALTMSVMGKDVLKQMIRQNPDVAKALNDPTSLVGASILVLLIIFGAVVGTCAAGGALGARFASRKSADHSI